MSPEMATGSFIEHRERAIRGLLEAKGLRGANASALKKTLRTWASGDADVEKAAMAIWAQNQQWFLPEPTSTAKKIAATHRATTEQRQAQRAAQAQAAERAARSNPARR